MIAMTNSAATPHGVERQIALLAVLQRFTAETQGIHLFADM
ncbi:MULTISPECIES: hypothetical protein [Paraburkholderia]|nr:MULTISPECIES: hypothetical protein [Paraburkholderia]MDH6150162.1 hypothetical protein [Paraburkholderia sp. WSM4179]